VTSVRALYKNFAATVIFYASKSGGAIGQGSQGQMTLYAASDIPILVGDGIS
jgi:hypothetical protein